MRVKVSNGSSMGPGPGSGTFVTVVDHAGKTARRACYPKSVKR